MVFAPAVLTHTGVGRGGFGRGMATFWRKLIDKPNTSPLNFWQIFLQSSLTS